MVDARAQHRPVPARARVVLEWLHVVRAAIKHALPRQRHDVASIGGAVGVDLRGDKLLLCLLLAPARGRKLGDLDDPRAPDGLIRLLAVHARQAVGEPSARQDRGEAGLADPLRADEYQHRVELAARLIHALDGGGHPLARDGAGIGCVLRAHVAHEQGVEALRAVPAQPVEVFPHGVVGVLVCDDRPGVADLVLPDEPPRLLHVQQQVRVVGILPQVAVFCPPPWQIAPHDRPHRELVDGERAAQSRVVAQDERRVRDRGVRLTGLAVHAQLRQPCVVRRLLLRGRVCTCGRVCLRACGRLLRCACLCRVRLVPPGHLAHVGEVCVCLGKVLGEEGAAAGLVSGHERTHGLIARAAGDLLLLAVGVQLAELMHAHEVEGVAQHPARRVGRVVGVEELAVLVHDRAAAAASGRVGVARLPARQLAWYVHAGQEALDGGVDVERPAELADDTGLGLRVALPSGLAQHHGRLLLADRPQARVPPCAPGPVLCQHAVGVEDRAVLLAEHVLPVLRAARPVHQPLRLVGRWIHLLDVDPLGHLACHGRVFLRGHGSAQRNDPAQARRFGRV